MTNVANLDHEIYSSQLPIELLEATLSLTSTVDFPELLQEFVKRAANLTGARFGAFGVLDNRGETAAYAYHGISPELEALIGPPLSSKGLVGAIPPRGHLILNELTTAAQASTMPKHHPQMNNFLGVPVRIRHQVFGRLYLCDKPDDFTKEDAANITLLAQAAAIAISNCRMLAESQNRERWIQVSQRLTTTLLEGTEEEEALELIAKSVKEVAKADTAIIVLPSLGDDWVCEIAHGYRAQDLIGVVFPPEGRAMTVLKHGQGMIVDSLARATTMRLPELAQFGAALYAPLIFRGNGTGVLVLLRRPGREEFLPSDLPLAEAVASQAALGLELSGAHHEAARARLLDERARIGRDLHDLAIQQLFATGMQLESARSQVLNHQGDIENIANALENALSSVDDSVRQIRSIVHSLKDPDINEPLLERLRRETSLARAGLGFAPSFVAYVSGASIESQSGDEQLMQQINNCASSDLQDDIVAVVREGLSNAARHAHSSSVQVEVYFWPHNVVPHIQVTIRDDGIGIPANLLRRSGLANLRTRARQRGGEFEVKPAPIGGGTLLDWQVPFS